MLKTYTRNSSVGEIVRQAEQDYTRGTTTISKYVQFSMHDTLERIDAYLNSKHTSGETDSLGREKPFFNIVTAAVNIWFRATDIDRSDIKIRATKLQDVTIAFLATVHLQDWMRKANFGVFLNDWGRILSRYGSAISKFVENSKGLSCVAMPWNRMIVDPIDFEGNVKIEVLELTEAQLRKDKRYNKDMVESLCTAKRARETLDKKKKDIKNNYIKLYELHGELSLATLKMSKGKEPKAGDEDIYLQQIHVLSYLASKEKKGEYDDFTLYSGEEAKDPYMITHLIKEDGRTLSIGAVEHLFDAQWMQNDNAKKIKDQLELASKIVYQTSDGNFVGQNALTSIENGDILIHAQNQPLTRLAGSPDIVAMQSFGEQWKSLGNEINGISDAMRGEVKAGAAWRQTETLLQEGHSLFEIMTENKGLAIEEMVKQHILPYTKKKMNHSKEISATLKQHDIENIDSKFIKNQSIRKSNKKIMDMVLAGKTPTAEDQAMMTDTSATDTKESLSSLGKQRFFKPSEISDKTWADITKNLEDDVEVDVTGEVKNVQNALTTLNTALGVIINPAYAQNKKAQVVVNKILELTGTLSSLELSTLPEPTMPVGQSVGSTAGTTTLPANQTTNG